MSEPDAAFLKLRIARENLVRWLDAPPPTAASWSDWRSISGHWYEGAGPKPLKDFSEAELAKTLAEADAINKRFSTNRACFRDYLDASDAPELRRATYDPATRDFVAGNLTYAENLTLFIAFLAVARGATAFLGPDEHGVAVIHNYIWGGDSERITQAAIRLGPDGKSEFLTENDAPSAAGAFQPIADEMMGGADGKTQPPVRDELDGLK